jgi:xanthine dehydrogenase YagT iron-sulfur-binding subunit
VRRLHVIVDGRRINACLTLAVMHEGSEITTIEGRHARPAAPDAGRVHQARRLPVRLLHAGADLLGGGGAQGIREGIPSHVSPSLTEAPQLIASELRERMSGNICRCGAYSNIIEAITEVAQVPA